MPPTTKAYNFINEPIRSLYETKFDVRLDHTFSSADTVFTRFSYDQAVSYVPGGGGPAPSPKPALLAAIRASSTMHGTWPSGRPTSFTPTTVNQFTFRLQPHLRLHHFARYRQLRFRQPRWHRHSRRQLGLHGPSAAQTCTKGAYSCGLVSVLLDGGYWSLGDRGYTPFQGGTDIFSFNDSLDLIRGKHDFMSELTFAPIR